MYEDTPSFVSRQLNAIFGKHNWKAEVVRIQNEVENIGFDQFSSLVWEADYHGCTSDQEKTIQTVADNFYIISEYYYDDNEPLALTWLANLFAAGFQINSKAGCKKVWELTDDLVHETELSGNLFNKEMVDQVCCIQKSLFWDITNLEPETNFFKNDFLYPWNISRDIIQVDKEKQKLFSNHFEAALYVAAWTIEFDEMFDNPPHFKEIYHSVKEYLSEHVTAIDNFNPETELGIYDLNDYLPEQTPTNFHEYFLLALKEVATEYSLKNNDFCQNYRGLKNEEKETENKYSNIDELQYDTWALKKKFLEADGNYDQQWIVIKSALNNLSFNNQSYWNYQAADNHLKRKKYETALMYSFAALSLNEHEKKHFKKCIFEKKYQEMWLRTVDPTPIQYEDGEPALVVLINILTTKSTENPYFYPEAAHRFTSYILSNFSLYQPYIILDCLEVYFDSANQLQIKKELINLSFFGLFPLVFESLVEKAEERASKLVNDDVGRQAKDAIYKLLATCKKRFEQASEICFYRLTDLDFGDEEMSHAFQLLISDNIEIQDIPWIINRMAFEEWEASNFVSAKKLYEKLIDKKKRGNPLRDHLDLILHQAIAFKRLGRIFAAGDGVVKNRQKALAHFYMAKALDPECIDTVELYELEKSCTPSQLENAENHAATLMEDFEAEE